MNRISTDALSKLKCSSCSHFLSVFPIYLDNKEQSTCGRCTINTAPTSEQELFRNVAYENVARSLLFPCAFVDDGCLEYYYPEEMAEHERNVHQIPCPAWRTTSCEWTGSIDSILSHCGSDHPNFVLQNGIFEVDLLNTHESHNLLSSDDELFVIKRQFNTDTNILHCWVNCLKYDKDSKRYNYEIIMKDVQGSNSMKFPEKPTSDKDKFYATEIVIERIKKELNDPPIIVGQVNINPTVEAHNGVNPKAIAELECPVCFQFMTSQIYLCDTGHSFCEKCKNSVVECPLCKAEVTKRRNITLEKMAGNLDFPCKYSGCSFLGTPDKLKNHQEFCYQKHYTCPVSDYVTKICKWSDFVKYMPRHIQETHHDHILDIETVSLFLDENYLNETDTMCYIKNRLGRIFKLHYCYIQNVFRWSMQLVGPPEESGNYLFEIEVVDGKNKQKRLYAKSSCSPLTTKDKIFEDVNSIWFLREQILQFVATDVFTYKVFVTTRH